jgi:precorrin-2 dehydrogenase/sirohydrochlorin ferrochelatase
VDANPVIIDFKFEGKYVVMVGGGSEAYNKALTFLDAGSKVLVVSRNFSSGIMELHRMKKIDLLRTEVKDGEAFVQKLKPKPDLLAIATSDHALNASLASRAKSAGHMVYAADNPAISDFILPAVARIGDVRVTISTGGKSPAMAKALRTRIEKLITKEDLLHIKLQEYMRGVLKQRIVDQKDRKKILYQVLEDEQVNKALKNEKLNAAKKMALKIMEKYEKEAK